MPVDMDIGSKESLTGIEAKISRLLKGPPRRQDSPPNPFMARISSDRRFSFFKDIWTSVAVAAGVEHCGAAQITAWGLKDWSKQDDEDGFALSYPSMIALQRGASVVTDTKPPQPLVAETVKRTISRSGGVLGTGARQRTIVELDPDLPTATPLICGPERRDVFFEFVRRVLSQLEIGAMARRRTRNGTRESPSKGTILEFLHELHLNGFEHGQAERNVRLLRIQKHLYPHRGFALQHAPEFAELAQYLEAQPERPSSGMFNLIEASVSDFGPGILDGFLAAFAGRAHQHRPRQELLENLLHEQLSRKSGDPNAGLGIGQALLAAHEMDAFVSLRTAEFWLTMRGRLDETPRLTFREGVFAKIVGTHWQLLLPDPTEDGRAGGKRA